MLLDPLDHRVSGISVAGITGEPLDILVVDDESELREQIRRLFERDGHRVMAVADGRAAIDRATTGAFDVVLSTSRSARARTATRSAARCASAATSSRSSC